MILSAYDPSCIGQINCVASHCRYSTDIIMNEECYYENNVKLLKASVRNNYYLTVAKCQYLNIFSRPQHIILHSTSNTTSKKTLTNYSMLFFKARKV